MRQPGIGILKLFLATAAAAGVAARGPVGRSGFDTIVIPGSTMTAATGINARGDIAGQYMAAGQRRGFVLDRDGTLTLIDYPGAAGTNVWSITASGTVVGDYTMAGSGARAFVLEDGEWTTFDCAASLNAVQTFAAGVNLKGEVVGEFKLPGVPLGGPGRAFRFDGTTCHDITPPDAGTGAAVAVGWTTNDVGEAGGYYVTSAGPTSGWLLDKHGNYTTLHYPGSVFTNLRGISNTGDMVGLYRLPAAPTVNRGFFLSSLGEWSPIDYPGSTRTRVLGINANGDMVGDYSGGPDCSIAACGWVYR
jgi:hypothetical protein